MQITHHITQQLYQHVQQLHIIKYLVGIHGY